MPFHYGMPDFKLSAIMAILIVMVITAVETVGSLYATGEIVHRRIKADDITRAIRADGVATFLGGSMGSFPYTCFAENIGLVRITGVKSRWVVATAGVFMIILGLFPKAAAIVALIPHPVLGGAALSLFAAVAIVGIQTLSGVDFNDHRNLAVAGTSIAMGIYVASFPAVQDAAPSWLQWYFSGGISAGAFTAILLNLLFFHLPFGHRGPAIKQGKDGLIRLDDINAMSEAEFERTFASVVQGQKWVLDRAWEQRPFETTADLSAAFQDVLVTASTEEQSQMIDSFADLGAEDAAGNSLTSEHAKGALANLQEDDYNDVVELANAYREHFQLPVDHLGQGARPLRTAAGRRLGPDGQLPHRRAAGRDDRDLQDRQLPLPRPGGQRQPDRRGTVRPVRRSERLVRACDRARDLPSRARSA